MTFIPRKPIMFCSVDSCERPHVARGLCDAHYKRLRTGKEVAKSEIADRSYIGLSFEEAFLSHVDPDGPVPSSRPDLGPCWLWTGTPKASGYGRFQYEHAVYLTHRLMYELTTGQPIKKGLHLDHLCRVTMCCNPEHLEPVTPRENQYRSDGIGGINHRKTHCIYGHEFTADNMLRDSRGNRRCRSCNIEWLRNKRTLARESR